VSFAVDAGDVYAVKKGKYVPLFSSKGVNFKYEAGDHGTNCYDLDTVLPRGSFVKVIDAGDDVVHVSCKVSENYSPEGFIHRKFFNDSMKRMNATLFSSTAPRRSVLGINEIGGIFDSLLEKEVPFGWGCNNFKELSLSELYTFTNGDGKSDVPYRCAGFDCSGLLHAISSWTLPHSTGQLYNLSTGECLCELDASSTDSELEEVLALMLDTDFVVFANRYPPKSGGHVIISFRGGFVEAKSRNFGVICTDEDGALSRLRDMTREGRVRVIRWHPELLALWKQSH
jgi:hypothetical protein